MQVTLINNHSKNENICQLFHIIQTIIHHTVVFKEARNIKRINSKLLKILRKTQLKKKEST